MFPKTICLIAVSFFLLLNTSPLAAQSASNTATSAASPRPPYLDPSLPADQRVNDLVSRMTLEEKASQMQDVARAIPRLGIPAYNWWNEALHGVARSGHATVFPQAIGLAATWDTDLIHRMADVISTEARAKYNDAIQRGNTGRYYGLTFWSPNINIFRDPRWGRGQETYGEDPFLTSRIGVAFVTGLQGDDPKYLKVVSTAKHFAVHSGPETLRHREDVPVSPRDFADTYAPAFRALVMEGHADSVMCAYNSVRGVPACANNFLFDTLRNKWGFKGYVVSDCWAISDIHQGHGFVLTLEQAAALAVKAGTDLSCGPEYASLPFAVENRLLAPADVDLAVKHLFEARFRLGMFDPPESVPWSKLTIADNDTPAHRQLALEAARKSIVLLKNERNTLPLKSTVKTIAVVGPDADSLPVLLGNYAGTPSAYTTILDGIRKRFRSAKVITATGAPLTETSGVILPNSYLRTGGANSQPGLSAEYFANPNLSGDAALKRVDAAVRFEWNNVSPGPGMPAQNFSVRWSGELVPPVDGDYRLGMDTDGGSRIFLDGKKIIDDWAPHSERTMTTMVHLQAGHAYPIRMEYFHHGWESAARLLWLPPNLVQEAVEAARKADVVVAVVGLTAQLEGEESENSDPGFFGGDRLDLDLPHPQEQLLESLVATGKPLIVVLTTGSAVAVNWAQEHASAILEAWYPGEEGGAAVADVLSGDYNPAGRLPVTFYKSVAQIPPFGSYSMNGRTYRYFTEQPLYPFGYGLSFSSFNYSDAKITPDQTAAGTAVTASVRVTNSSSVSGEEVVELYLSHPGIDGAPIRALAGFQRVHLAASASQTVTFTLHDRDLSTVDEKGIRKVVPGPAEVWIGGGQPVSGPGQPPTKGISTKFNITSAATLDE
ncbi:MAG TPA: glycoside hydrolase family 3 C-terminal domain-containing protein [Candidatus Acidoferrum sp.]|nr:glycoside hydrolase family 3 C-terminal domain-containing protein [Candidatus Acidoferrum sp.]